MSLFDGPTEHQLAAIHHLFDTIVANEAKHDRIAEGEAALLDLWKKCAETVIPSRSRQNPFEDTLDEDHVPI